MKIKPSNTESKVLLVSAVLIAWCTQSKTFAELVSVGAILLGLYILYKLSKL